MLIRAVSGTVYVALMLGALLAGDRVWSLWITLLAVQATREGSSCLRHLDIRVTPGIALPAAALLTYVGPSDLGQTLWALILALLFLAAFLDQLRLQPEARDLRNFGATLAVPAFYGVLLGHLRAGWNEPASGAAVLALLVAVWSADTGAYLGGRAFGRHKLAPRISPKKTWEGGISGALACYAALLGLATYGSVAATQSADPAAANAIVGTWHTFAAGLPQGPLYLLVLAILVSILGPLGDLSQSWLKREAGVKDSGHLIPGHGGVIDRIDSLLFAAPAAYWLPYLIFAYANWLNR